jgi:hypothetical protein
MECVHQNRFRSSRRARVRSPPEAVVRRPPRQRPQRIGDTADLHAAFSVLRVRLKKAEIAHLKRIKRADDKASDELRDAVASSSRSVALADRTRRRPQPSSWQATTAASRLALNYASTAAQHRSDRPQVSTGAARVPIPTKPPPCSAIIAPPDSEMISPPWAGALLA